jgi:nitroreductase
MNAYQTVSSLRSIRQFVDRSVPDEILIQILEAGRWTGSSKNTQPWQFVVIRERDTLARLARCGRFAGHLKGAAFAIALVMDPGRTDFDAGRCAQNLMLAAWSQGVGSCIASMHDEDIAKDVLGVPQERGMRTVISFGYPAEDLPLTIEGKARERVLASVGRRPLVELVHWETW